MKSQDKKIALFLFPADIMGGAENVTLMLAEEALKSDLFDEVICFVLSQSRRGPLDSFGAKPKATLIYTGAGSEKMGLHHLFRILWKQPYDLVFASHTHMNAAASLMRKLGLLKTRRLVTRESTMIFDRDLGWFGVVARKLYSFYGGQDLIICQTDRMLQSLQKNIGKKFATFTRTVPNPIDIDAIKQATLLPDDGLDLGPQDATKIAWCGRLSPIKSPLRAVDALVDVHNRGYQNTHLVMMGKGTMRQEILTHADACGVGNHITLTGRVSTPAMIMRHCHLGLMTSDTEGFPNVILEMLASGINSVVTTDCAGGLEEIPGVHVAAGKTAEKLADQIVVQLENDRADQNIEPYLEQRSPAKFLQILLAS